MDIRNCPFCREKAEVSHDKDSMRLASVYPFSIFCRHKESCYLGYIDEPYFATEEEAIQAWEGKK